MNRNSYLRPPKKQKWEQLPYGRFVTTRDGWQRVMGHTFFRHIKGVPNRPVAIYYDDWPSS